MTNQKNQPQKNKQGFTIIEVVLVLAIAGLIFLMVFIALPALQRSQRDTQRRDDMARFATAIVQYQSNNGGKIPGEGTTSDITSAAFSTTNCNSDSANAATKLLCTYLNANGSSTNEFKDPDGTAYTIVIKSAVSQPTSMDHKVYFYPKAYCKGETVTTSSNARDYAIAYRLEGSGVYCSDSK